MRLFKYCIVLFLLLLLFLLAKMDSIILFYNKAKIVNSSINIDTLYNRYMYYDKIDSVSWHNSYKCFAFIDSLGCFDCNMKLDIHKIIDYELDVKANKPIVYMVITNSNKSENIRRKSLIYKFDKIFIDSMDLLLKCNDISIKRSLNTFLLSPKGEVLYVGDYFNYKPLIDSLLNYLK